MDKKCGIAGDDEVIQSVLSGDINAFEQIVTRYQPLVFAIVSRRLPAEAVAPTAHDVFVRAYRGLSGYQGKSGLKNWLSGIAVRTCGDFWRKTYRNREIAQSSLSDVQLKWIEAALFKDAETAREAEDRMIEIREITDHLLGLLSPNDRMVMELVYLEGYSHKEAAVLMGSNTVAVKVRAHRAKKKLRSYIETIGLNSDRG